MKNIVVIGGGTGTYVVLSGLKDYPVHLSAIITMMDSGGSTGRLRDQYGVLPPGDIRQALVALSHSDLIWRQLFLYRFSNGDLEGHNFGNLLLTALEKITGDFAKGLKLAEKILQTKGEVIPVTLKKTNIVAKLKDGTLIKNEALIDKEEQRPQITNLFLDKIVKANPQAVRAIKKADFIIVGPGDVYTSVLSNFVFKEIVQAYQLSTAKKIFILNLMNKIGQTDGFKASDFIKTYSKYLGGKPFDYILINNKPIPEKLKKHYSEFGEYEVVNDLQNPLDYKVFTADLLNENIYEKNKADKLKRSLIRHDANKIAEFIWRSIINNKDGQIY